MTDPYISNALCFEDLRRSSCVASRIEVFIEDFCKQISTPNLKIVWRNIQNQDHNSSFYNPIGSVGRLFAVECSPPDATPPWEVRDAVMGDFKRYISNCSASNEPYPT